MSSFFKLNIADVGRGLIMAVLAGVLAFVYEALQTGVPVDWHQVLLVGITAGLGYLIKNFFSEEGKFLGSI